MIVLPERERERERGMHKWFGFGNDFADTEDTTPLSKELYEELPPPADEMGRLRSGRRGSVYDAMFTGRWNDLGLIVGVCIITLYLLMYIHPSILIRPASSSSSSTEVSSQNYGRVSSQRPKIHFITYGKSAMLCSALC